MRRYYRNRSWSGIFSSAIAAAIVYGGRGRKPASSDTVVAAIVALYLVVGFFLVMFLGNRVPFTWTATKIVFWLDAAIFVTIGITKDSQSKASAYLTATFLVLIALLPILGVASFVGAMHDVQEANVPKPGSHAIRAHVTKEAYCAYSWDDVSVNPEYEATLGTQLEAGSQVWITDSGVGLDGTAYRQLIVPGADPDDNFTCYIAPRFVKKDKT